MAKYSKGEHFIACESSMAKELRGKHVIACDRQQFQIKHKINS